ncbi:MAG TPA: hypothetical protein VFB78_06925 [Acidimicrobiales bacterium]|nr:hypothetical protein [Acidimicrobiales bacterium]
MTRRAAGAFALAVAVLGLGVPAGRAAEYGALSFPKDEHAHVGGWDYWWGAADLAMTSGNHYTVGVAFNSHYGYGVTGHQVFPRQGPYKGQSIMTMDGPAEWGHPGEATGRFARTVSTYIPGVSELLRYQTLDTGNGLKDIGLYERTSLDRESYHLRLDDDQARVHPIGRTVKLVVDLRADMAGPPLLAGGTGTWWYGIPETFGYPSRSFQYMQAAKTIAGTLDLQQPDGSLLRETVASTGSTMVMTHEYDASPEDLFAGLALAEATQLHPRYAQYYAGGMPWELLFLDLKNGAQLMVALLAFHDTNRGLATPAIGGKQPTYRVLATLRLPTGESVPLDDVLHVEHLSYRNIVGHVPTFLVQVDGMWTQAWDYRMSYPGGRVKGPGGRTASVPAFDLGVVPQFARNEPASDDSGNWLAQRVPFVASGSYDGCPVRGFGWSELIVNWYGREDRDPWYTAGAVPPIPSRCGVGGETPPIGTPGELNPPAGESAAPRVAPEGCVAYDAAPTCEYDATVAAGGGGYSAAPGGWTVTIRRPGAPAPIVVTGFGGSEMYMCGTIRPGDHVVVAAQAGSIGFAGNPLLCF